MTVRNILKAKGSAIFTAGASERLQRIAKLINEHRIGAVVIVEGGDRPIGIVSERDIVNALAAFGAATLDMPAADVMSRSLMTCMPDDGADELLRRMTNCRVRHLPVVEEGRLTGMVSIGDVVKLTLEKATAEVGLMRDYVMAGR